MKRLLLIVLLVLAAPASAATRYEVIDDCSDDSRLQGRYTAEELRDARRNLRTEVAEYTDCADVLRRAELALVERTGAEGAAGAPPTTGGDDGAAATPLVPADEPEQRALQQARADAPAPVTLRGRAVEPGSAGFTTGAVRNDMPGSLLGALIALALVMAGLLVVTVRGFGPWRGGEPMRNDPWRPIP